MDIELIVALVAFTAFAALFLWAAWHSHMEGKENVQRPNAVDDLQSGGARRRAAARRTDLSSTRGGYPALIPLGWAGITLKEVLEAYRSEPRLCVVAVVVLAVMLAAQWMH